MEAYIFLRKKYFVPPEKSLNEFSTPTFTDWDSLVKLLEEYSCQIEPLVIPKIAEEIRVAINKLQREYFTENFDRSWIYANDVQNFCNALRNKTIEIIESNFSE